ncbi:MAG TPA: YraN family protein [Blastocatellia bacterium]|nr:YraN family protein [Blastocatellia bacterium]
MIERIRARLRRRTGALRAPHLRLGELGERMALNYLTKSIDYRLVATNFRVPLGRGLRGQKLTAEIDVIAYDENTLVFIEVKTRTSDEFVQPERSVDLRKQRQIARAARRYRQLMKVYDEPYRYDVLAILQSAECHEVELLRGYFDDRVFQRGRYFSREPGWSDTP